MGLQQFEERLGRLMEGTLARPFRKSLQPVDIARKLTREMDLNRRVSARGLIAPNKFVVHVSPADAIRFASFVDALCRELVVAAKEHAQTDGYSFVGTVVVEIYEDLDLKTGDCDVEGTFAEIAKKAQLRSQSGETYQISEVPITVGRQGDNTIVVHDTNVSRRHLSIVQVGPRYLAKDLGSTNGTYVNKKRVTEVALQDRDVITVGTATLTVELS